MDAKELREWAERCVDPESDVFEQAKCGRRVARAWLAANRADDGEPVDQPWLESVGFVRDGGILEHSDLPWIEWHIGGDHPLMMDNPNKGWVRLNMTRGDVRRLARSLSTPLTEPA